MKNLMSYLGKCKSCILCIHILLFMVTMPGALYAQLGGVQQDAENWKAATDTTRLIAIVPEKNYVNKKICVKYRIYGVDEQGKVQPPTNLVNLELEANPTITVAKNGDTIKFVDYSYFFIHNGPGIYNIGTAKWINSKGKSKESRPLSIEVLPECAPTQIKRDTAYIQFIKSFFGKGITPPENWQNDFFIRREMPQSVKGGSTFRVTYKLYLRNQSIAVYEIIPPIYPTRQVKHITPLSDERKTSVENYEGEWCYTIILWQADLIAPSAGSMVIKEMSVVCAHHDTPWVEEVAKIPTCTLQIAPN